jgi:hemoglobin/transferrin/lactoferrin receptor protein
MRIQAGVYNLFDKTYYDALAVRSINPLSASSQPMEFYSQPGRTFKVSLTHKF